MKPIAEIVLLKLDADHPTISREQRNELKLEQWVPADEGYPKEGENVELLLVDGRIFSGEIGPFNMWFCDDAIEGMRRKDILAWRSFSGRN